MVQGSPQCSIINAKVCNYYEYMYKRLVRIATRLAWYFIGENCAIYIKNISFSTPTYMYAHKKYPSK